METGKFFFVIAFVSAVAAIFTGVNYFQGVDNANGQMLEAKKNLAQAKEAWKVRHEEWTKIEAIAKKARDAASQEVPPTEGA